jgi:CheY-like chemotaxis protein
MSQSSHAIAEKPFSILIVDGDDKERHDLGEQLRQVAPAFVFHYAATGRTAMEFLASHFVDCVLLELDLKDMSGFEILNSLVPSPSKPRIAVVVRTRLSHPSLLLVAKQNGAQAALVKNSTTPEMVHSAIAQAIAAVPRSEKVPVTPTPPFPCTCLSPATLP